MANLTPVPGLDPVPQLETTTLALGGPAAPMNAQAQALLNRIESVRDAQDDHETAPDPHPQYTTPSEVEALIEESVSEGKLFYLAQI